MSQQHTYTQQTRWMLLHPRATRAHLGYLPEWINQDDPDPAWKQIDKNYQHGGGWYSSGTKARTKVMKDHVLKFPGDPPMHPIAMTTLRDELIFMYDHAWVAIFQPNGDWDLARID